MFRISSYCIAATFLLATLVGSASATTIFVQASPARGALNSQIADLYSSSFGGQQSGDVAGNNFRLGLGSHPHNFAMAVPVASETPEPSTLTLFGSGLIVVAGAFRRKFRR